MASHDDCPPAGAQDVARDLYRDLFLAERARRETIRSGVAVPTAAISFTVFALGTLSNALDLAHGRPWTVPILLALGLAAVGCLVTAICYVIRMEWIFMYHEPPDLAALLDAEARIRDRLSTGPGAADGLAAEAEVRRQLEGLLTAAHAVAYARYLAGNEESNRRRTRALRYVLLALLCVALGFAVVPFHAPAGALRAETAEP